MNSGYAVDLRSEVDRFFTFFDDRGGVAHARSAPGAPISVFARKLRMRMTEMGWRHVQIHPANSNTHYVADILVQITQSLGLDVPSPSVTDRPVSIQVGAGIEAGGPVEISNVNINVGGDPFEGARREREVLRSVESGLNEALRKSRIALVFVEMFQAEKTDVQRIRNVLWDAMLEPLTDQGLVMVDISDAAAANFESSIWPPQPDLAFDLPIALTDDGARTDAVAELAEIVLSEGLVNGSDEAIVASRMLVSTTTSIVELHESLARAIAGWPMWGPPS
jgi:hypothetical protein